MSPAEAVTRRSVSGSSVSWSAVSSQWIRSSWFATTIGPRPRCGSTELGVSTSTCGDSNYSFFCGSQLLNEGDNQMEAVSEWNGRTSREIVWALRERGRTAAHPRHDMVLEHAGRHLLA